MSSFFQDYLENSSIFDVIQPYWSSLYLCSIDSLKALRDFQFKSLQNLPDSFSEFQWTLLKGFSLVLAINFLLIVIAWRVYGQRICERFMKPATSKAIEELKASVSRLKLPKEHSPRV